MKFKVGDIVTNIDQSSFYKDYKGLRFKVIGHDADNHVRDIVYKLILLEKSSKFNIGKKVQWYGRRLAKVKVKKNNCPSWL